MECTFFMVYLKPQARLKIYLLKLMQKSKLQTELISDKELQKLQNKYENQYVNSNASIEGVASNLATYYMLYNDVNLINTEIEMYRTITPEDIRTVAKKYLNPTND
jgi:predicted Zn-dependent peptidase